MTDGVSIKIAEDVDFRKLQDMVDSTAGWVLDYDKGGIKVWSQEGTSATSKMIKVIGHFPAVDPIDLYDVIHDPDYRKLWDHSMIESVDIGHLNPNNDVCYYAVSCPPPMKNRDFVLLRSWLDMGTVQYIINHSVVHDKFPPRVGRVRAVSLFTGYLIQQSPEGGCILGYVTQSDLQGDLPSWLVNKGTQILAPKYVRQLEKAALGYKSWKLKNQPNLKPWHYPEQISSPKLSNNQAVLVLTPPRRSPDSHVRFSPICDNPASCLESTAFLKHPPPLLKVVEGQSQRPGKIEFLSCLNFGKHCFRKKPDETVL